MSAGGRQDRGAGTRAVAARVLDAVLHGGHSLKAELAAALPQLPDPRDRALVEAIVFAALRQRARCEAALAQWMPRPPGRRDGILRALLYAGFVQLDALRLPPHAALAATVDAARLLGRAHQAGVVNALLRRAQRDGLPAVDAAAQWPAWLLDMLRRDRPAQLADIVRASAEPGPLWLRVNRRLATPEGMLAGLAASRIAAVQVPACPDALRIDAPVPVSALPGFADGELSVQEGSAQLVADALSPMPAANVLDACSAPGGKAAHLLERDRSLRLLALDVDRKRLERVRATFARLALDGGGNVQLRVADATDTPAWWDGKPFDAILLDAPCSATGVVRRQPDILLHRRASDIDELVAGQARLLDALWAVLAPGGKLLYATCSILRRENDVQVAAFLARTPGARLQPLDARFGEDTGHGSQRLPGQDDMDGFFYARIGKPIHFAA